MLSETKFDVHEYAIGGKMVVGRATMSEHYKMLIEDGNEDAKNAIKNKLISDMAHFILENNLVEFAYYDDPITMNRQVAVRAYLAPNDQIRILRLANKI